jgi:hypothetical protein
MKLIFAAAICVASIGAASAEPSNRSPQALACMKKFGFTYEQWRAYEVPAEKAVPYRACRDAAASTYSSGKVLASEPPPRALGAGQTVYVSCGGGKSRSVTGGSSSQPRTYGECK